MNWRWCYYCPGCKRWIVSWPDASRTWEPDYPGFRTALKP